MVLKMMVAYSLMRTFEVISEKKTSYTTTALKCVKQIKLPVSVDTCITCSNLPWNITTIWIWIQLNFKRAWIRMWLWVRSRIQQESTIRIRLPKILNTIFFVKHLIKMYSWQEYEFAANLKNGSGSRGISNTNYNWYFIMRSFREAALSN